MNFEKYQKETIRTFAYRKESLNTSTTDMLHCAIGIATEVGEFTESGYNEDIVNYGEEIADILWYVSNLANFIKLDLSTINIPKEPETQILSILGDNLVIYSGNLLDIFKKAIFYNQEINIEKIKITLIRIIETLNKISSIQKLDIYELMDKNIAKLKIRFPEKFTDELAKNRNLSEERKALEN